ncbi:universal stress protein [Alteromonas sp. ASW11-19]|uniref:Universal stress protein n=1 Tax=Alteromonas salexigens TaxID=2982530 RepID=A0ABT2VLE6_9ALTE|nr:universal stress protein [Alteromonas salexigens]MCU7554131.1 universal stress protein [Alteromonas salexigens]
MSDYDTILVALDVYAEHEPVINRAMKMASSSSAVHLLYVTYPQTNFEPYGLFLERDYSTDIQQHARARLQEVAEKHSIPSEQIHVAIGSPADQIHRTAESVQADLIVIGTHGQSGMQLLLGSTANAVLHGVKTDVLAVKV